MLRYTYVACLVVLTITPEVISFYYFFSVCFRLWFVIRLLFLMFSVLSVTGLIAVVPEH